MGKWTKCRGATGWPLLGIMFYIGLPWHGHGQDDLRKGLLLHLPLTSDLKDHSGRNLPVKVSGKVMVRDGAAYFAGNKDWLQLPHLPLNEGPFAFSLWIKLTANHPVYGVIQQRDVNRRNRHFHLMLRRNLQPHFGFYINDCISPTSVGRNEWLHLVVQHDGQYQQVWVTSRLLCQRKADPYEGSSGPTFIGRTPRWTNVPSHDFVGFMRDVRLYSRALALQDIFSLHRLGSDAGTGIARGSEQKEQPAPDPSWALPFLSINGHELTINGTAGEVYELQATTNLLKPWQPLAMLTNIDGKLNFIDEEARKFNERFYRIEIKSRD